MSESKYSVKEDWENFNKKMVQAPRSWESFWTIKCHRCGKLFNAKNERKYCTKACRYPKKEVVVNE